MTDDPLDRLLQAAQNVRQAHNAMRAEALRIRTERHAQRQAVDGHGDASPAVSPLPADSTNTDESETA